MAESTHQTVDIYQCTKTIPKSGFKKSEWIKRLRKYGDVNGEYLGGLEKLFYAKQERCYKSEPIIKTFKTPLAIARANDLTVEETTYSSQQLSEIFHKN